MRLLGLALLFAATTAMADTPPPQVQAPAPAQQAPPASIWRPSPDRGLEHLQSGLACPGRVQRYSLTSVHNYDEFGLDVSCNYKIDRDDITVYVTRRPSGDIAAAMTEAKRELFEVKPERRPQLITDSEPVIAGTPFLKSAYSIENGLHTTIWIADLNGWTLEYRATFVAANDATLDADIATLTRLVQGSAGARLAVCLKSSPPIRTGVRVVDKQQLEQQAMMTSLLGGAARAAAQDPKAQLAKAPQPIVFCVEQSLKRNGHPLLFWRGVNPSGADAQADKISLVTQGSAPTIDITADELANLVSKSKDASAPISWTASNEHGGKVTIFGYFKGRPSADAAADLFDDVVMGRTKALGGYSVDGKTVNVSMPAAN